MKKNEFYNLLTLKKHPYSNNRKFKYEQSNRN